jgi:zinc transport system permease protein
VPDAAADAGLPDGLSESDLHLDGSEAAPAIPHARELRDPHPHGDLPDHRQLHAQHVPHHAPEWQEFVSGWELGIYRDPVLCAALIGGVLGLLGVFIVLRKAVFVTAAVTQAAGLGVALSFLLASAGLSIPALVAAAVCAIAAAAAMLIPAERFRLPRESLLGFVFLAASAGALLVGDRIVQEAHDVSAILFGTAVLVRREHLLATALVAGAVLLTLAALYRAVVFAGVDREGARVQGLPVRVIEAVFWGGAALMISVATRALGALPVFAFAVLPAMASLCLVRRLKLALLLAAVLGAASGVLGYLFAFFYEFPVGASQALLAAVPLALALPIAALRRRFAS